MDPNRRWNERDSGVPFGHRYLDGFQLLHRGVFTWDAYHNIHTAKEKEVTRVTISIPDDPEWEAWLASLEPCSKCGERLRVSEIGDSRKCLSCGKEWDINEKVLP